MMQRHIYLTVDVECHDYARVNQYIQGKVGEREYGLRRILDLGREMQIPIHFFLDVVECRRYGDPYIGDIVRMIRSYGQPIYFHLHPNYVTGDEARTFLWQYSEDEQRAILQEGLDDYHRLVGPQEKLIFRAGRYGVDASTYKVLGELDMKVLDLSYVSRNRKMCHISKEVLGVENVCATCSGVTILPNTIYIGFDYCGREHCFNLDASETPTVEFKRFLKSTKLNDLVYTMHSWNFIRKWFFLPNYIRGDKGKIRRFRKCVAYARKQGFAFGSLTEYEPREGDDELMNLCRGVGGKSMSLIANFLRFQSIGRLNRKYFIIYTLGYGILFLMIAALFLLL